MPVGEFVITVWSCDQEVGGNLCTIFQSMRGSKQYWFLRCSEVLCMVREYGSPTLFLTLSCAEYDSVRIATYLRKFSNWETVHRGSTVCVEKFSQKCHDFFDTVILKGKALGDITHHFYKIVHEWQVQMTMKLLRWIQERITCRMPEEDSNTELHHLVTKYQSHKCNNYCRRRKRVKGTYITQCRFGFPRPTCDSDTLHCLWTSA